MNWPIVDARRRNLVGSTVLVALTAYQILVLLLWLKLDSRPPRWDESTQLLLAQHSFDALKQFKIFDALKVTDLTLTKSGFVPFLSALTYFVFGSNEQLATAVLDGTSIAMLSVAFCLLSRRLFNDSFVAAACFALIMASRTVVLFSHFYTVDLALMSLVAFTIAAALEVRVRDLRLSGWSFALGATMLIGIGAKHLYAPFVAAPLLVIMGNALTGVPWRDRLKRFLKNAAVVVPPIMLGIGYHVINWRIIAEQLHRATAQGFFSELGNAPSQWAYS